MSADMKAAMETARSAIDAKYPINNLAAAFREVMAELEQERKVSKVLYDTLENARSRADLAKSRIASVQFKRAESAEQRAADLQARLDRAEAETIERCWKEAWSKGAPDYIVQAIRALGAQNAAAGQDNQANSPFTDGVEPSPSSGVLPNTSGPAPAADPIIAHSKSMYKRLVTQGANVVPPAAPDAMLPGLWLAKKLLGPQSDKYNINGYEAIRAEIERRINLTEEQPWLGP